MLLIYTEETDVGFLEQKQFDVLQFSTSDEEVRPAAAFRFLITARLSISIRWAGCSQRLGDK